MDGKFILPSCYYADISKWYGDGPENHCGIIPIAGSNPAICVKKSVYLFEWTPRIDVNKKNTYINIIQVLSK